MGIAMNTETRSGVRGSWVEEQHPPRQVVVREKARALKLTKLKGLDDTMPGTMWLKTVRAEVRPQAATMGVQWSDRQLYHEVASPLDGEARRWFATVMESVQPEEEMINTLAGMLREKETGIGWKREWNGWWRAIPPGYELVPTGKQASSGDGLKIQTAGDDQFGARRKRASGEHQNRRQAKALKVEAGHVGRPEQNVRRTPRWRRVRGGCATTIGTRRGTRYRVDEPRTGRHRSGRALTVSTADETGTMHENAS
ncbi:unnamed protein product [Phytophthora fragariaefolia]|uniref:Unnamed protein product n=1 Tax=Phytophthora fragariaefolia TaxID=1490495 RepID=A0A9W6Y811_9STRA|nr:unnamed protein product [Phytophthora fragariaefolia]